LIQGTKMKQIIVNGTKYNVYGRNEQPTNKNPHIENAITGDVPQGEQMFILKSYLAAKNIPIKDKITTHECIGLVLKEGKTTVEVKITPRKALSKAKESKVVLPLTEENILKYDKAVYESPNYGKEAKIIHDVLNAYPLNDDLNTVAMKVAVIDVTNSTHISQYKSQVSLYDIAELIVGIDRFDERLKAGDPELVNLIANTGKINMFSFASKYCTYHNYEIYGRDDYSIYDGVVKSVLPHYISGVTSHKIDSWRLNYDYKSFNDLIGKLLDENGITMPGRRRMVDHFLWYTNR